MAGTIATLQRELMLETGAKIAPLGFETRLTKQCFERKMEGGRSAVFLAFIKHSTDFDVTTRVAVRFDAVEELVNRWDTWISSKEKRNTYTLGVELGNLERGSPFRFSVSSGADVPVVADGIVERVRTLGLPYLERYSRLEDAYDLLSRDDPDVWIHSPFHGARAMRACALLAVMGREEELQVVGKRKLAALRAADDLQTDSLASLLAEFGCAE